MNENWRNNAVLISKYNPKLKDENGHYNTNEWVGFFQIGKVVDGKELTFASYLSTEERYIDAAISFFKFHTCDEVLIKNLEKKNLSDYSFQDKEELNLIYNSIFENSLVKRDEIKGVIKLILRDLIWAELFCPYSNDIAIRFGYDYYMYFNSASDMSSLFKSITSLGLFVD